MKKLLVLLTCLLPLPALAQYIGNPAGKAVPLGASGRRVVQSRGFSGLEGGYMDMALKTEYDTIDGTIKGTSRLEEGYFAFYGGAHTGGFEIDGKVGGTFQELKETSTISDSFQSGAGFLVGSSIRYGFSPFYGFRFGLGGMFTYSSGRGRTDVTNGAGYTFSEPIDLDLWRGHVFGGIALDLQPRKGLCFSPYVGVGGEFIGGKLVFRRWDYWYYYYKDVGDIDEETSAFGYAGLDIHISNRYRVGLEGKGNDSGWHVMANIGATF